MTYKQKLILLIIQNLGLLGAVFFANLAMRLTWDHALINVIFVAMQGILTYVDLLQLGKLK